MDEPGEPARRGLVLEPYQVLLRPLVTEKNVHKSEKLNVYTFEVHPQADKLDIRTAVETMFNVRVLRVRTQNRLGKPRRTKFVKSHTKPSKRAIVTLHEDSRINFF